jgi:nonsense-mediated mRNA decay protein 3
VIHIFTPTNDFFFFVIYSYNLSESNINDTNFDKLNKDNVPDVILVKKFYPDRRKKRVWKLKHLPRDDISVGSANV